MKQSSPAYPKHHFLIVMPHMANPNLAQTMTYLVEHNEQGAMGLVINHPSGLNLAEVLEQLKSDALSPARCQHIDIYNGGPVQTDRGFVLYPSGLSYQPTLELGELAMLTLQDVLFAIAAGIGPEKSLVNLGYAGWEAGQLETELSDNAWLIYLADPAILFDLPAEERLSAAAARLGVNLSLLTAQVGHA